MLIDRLARDDEVVAEEQLVDVGHGAGDGALHRHDGVAGPAVGDGVEGLLERRARHEPGAGAEERLRRFFAVGAGRALIRGVGEGLVEVYMLHLSGASGASGAYGCLKCRRALSAHQARRHPHGTAASIIDP